MPQAICRPLRVLEWVVIRVKSAWRVIAICL